MQKSDIFRPRMRSVFQTPKIYYEVSWRRHQGKCSIAWTLCWYIKSIISKLSTEQCIVYLCSRLTFVLLHIFPNYSLLTTKFFFLMRKYCTTSSTTSIKLQRLFKNALPISVHCVHVYSGLVYMLYMCTLE
jgi:hypothetical protein